MYDKELHFIDSHTGGEPTRIVVGGLEILGGTVAEQLVWMRENFDEIRSAVVNEPRGSDILVGGVLLEPSDSECVAGIIFFNNVGYLGMCGHGTIGLMATLAYMKAITPGTYFIETPVGKISATFHDDGEFPGDGSVSVRNVPSYRYAKAVEIEVDGYGRLTGDIAWGGNWFFLVEQHGQLLTLENTEALTDFTWRIRMALEQSGVTGANGQEIDHIELFSASPTEGVDSRNFVLCPGKAYDRSPCGTGTSAKLACLYEDGKIKIGEVWRQESITGSIFEGSVELVGKEIIPTIRGRAYVNSVGKLILNRYDPLCFGIRR